VNDRRHGTSIAAVAPVDFTGAPALTVLFTMSEARLPIGAQLVSPV
jgi:hypothetical protein